MNSLKNLSSNNYILSHFLTAWIIIIQIFIILMDKTNRKVKRWVWESLYCFSLVVLLSGMLHFIIVDKRKITKLYNINEETFEMANILTHFVPFLIVFFYKPKQSNLVGKSNPIKSFLLGLFIFMNYNLMSNMSNIYLISYGKVLIISIGSLLLYYLLLHIIKK